MVITHVFDTLTQVKGVIVQDKGENLWISSTFYPARPAALDTRLHAIRLD